MSRVLVTGITGFIGSELIPKLIESKHELYGIARCVTGRTLPIHGINTYFADFRDGFLVRKIIREVQPDVVIHLGAQSRVSESYEHPQEFIETNLVGTINMAEACLREIHNFKQFIFASTSEVFGNNGLTVQIEESPMKPASPYAVSKVGCENYLNYMKEAYNFPTTLMHPYNTFGRTKERHFLIEKTICQMLTQNEIFLIDPKPIRDWMYIDDHVNAYLTCLLNEKAIGESFNFCTGIGMSVNDTVNKIAEILDFGGKINWESSPKRPTESQIIIGDNSKAYKLLNWRPKFTFEEGIKLTIENLKKALKI